MSERDGDATGRAARFARVMRALNADVICLQEFTSEANVVAAMDRLLPLDGRHWQAHSALGNVIVSRFSLTQRISRTMRFGLSRRAHVIARVDVPDDAMAPDPVVVCTHLQAKGGRANAAYRQRQAEDILRTLDSLASRDTAERASVVMGDMNAIDGVAPYFLTPAARLIAPRIELSDARPLHNGVGPERYTWRDDRQSFAPGVLDYILFSGRSFIVRQGLVLNTMSLDSAMRSGDGLRAGDAARWSEAGAYDHLPVVLDLELRRSGR